MQDMLAAPQPAQPNATPEAQEDEGTPLDVLVQWFEDAEEATTEARKAAERARDYYDGKQLTSKELKTLKDRGQPDIIINRIQPKINYLLGFEASNRTDPKAYPRTPDDEDAAAAATDGLRYVKDKTELEMAFSGSWENLLVEGYGGLELTVVEGANGQKEFEIIKWDWDRLFYDPHSRKPDFSDARYNGGIVWMDLEDAKRQWPDKTDVFEKTWAERTASQTYDDKPIHQQWTQKGSRRRVRVVQMYHREQGQWVYCVFTKGGKLDSYAVPFVDQDGRSWNPLLMQSAFVDRDNNRYGLVNAMIGPQDEINKRRSKALHRITMRQVKAERGAVDDVEITKRELSKPDGFIEINPGFQFEVLDTSDQLAGEINLLQHAQNEIELMGPNSAMQGKQDGAPSGRAIMANQNGGQTEISILLDRLTHLKRRTYQMIWNLIRQYKDQEWWVRVTDNDDNVKFVGFNRPVTMAEDLQKRMTKSGMQPDELQAKMQELQADPNVMQQLQQVVRQENVASQMYMDITLEQAPATANIMQEQFDALIKLASVVPMPPEVYLQASSFRNKRELIEKVKAPQPDPVAMEFQKIKAEQDIEKTEAEIEKLKAEALKSRVDADIAQMNPMGLVADPTIQKNIGAPAPGGESVPPPGLTGDAMPTVPPTM